MSASPESRDLRQWLDVVERHGGLARIGAQVDPVEELSALTFLASRKPGSPAFLFENVAGNRIGGRVLTNMLAASKERYALAVGIDPALPVRRMVEETRRISGRRLPPVTIPASAAPVREVTLSGDEIDLTDFPVPKFWPGDGGLFIGTGNVTFIANPDTGVINAGVYRQMLQGPRAVGLNMVPGRHGERNVHAWWKRGLPAPVITAYGVDPALFIASTQAYAHEESELDVAGGLAGTPIEMTPADLSDLPIPARAEVVVEGFVHEGDVSEEGPLGEFHGYYSGKRDLRPVIRVERVHYRPNPILTGALMATWPSCEIGEYHAIMRSARVWDNLAAMGVPGIEGVYIYPASASAAGVMAISMKQLFPGHVAQVLALAAQCPAAAYVIRWIIAVDDDIDPSNFGEVMWAMSVHSNPVDDIDILRHTYSYRTDPSLHPSERPYGSKALIDACLPLRHGGPRPRRARLSRATYEKVVGRWAEFNLPDQPAVLTHFHEDD